MFSALVRLEGREAWTAWLQPQETKSEGNVVHLERVASMGSHEGNSMSAGLTVTSTSRHTRSARRFARALGGLETTWLHLETDRMQDFSPETTEALEAGRVALFVYFDFEFFPVWAHSGHGTINWNEQDWTGVGDVLRRNSVSKSALLSSMHSSRSEVAASLSLGGETQEVIARQYYRDRKMEWSLCALSRDGQVLERVHYNEGAMVGYVVEEDVLTFRAECKDLDSTEELDARHKSTVESVRKRFKWEIRSFAKAGGVGWAVNAALASVGEVLGSLLDLIGAHCSSSNRRAVRQRLQARKRAFWFRTEPAIPKLRLRRRGYRIAADTLEEAKTELYGRAAEVVWEFPRGSINMLVYLDDRLLEMFDLDHVRRLDDVERWKASDPLRRWLKATDDGDS